MCFAPQRRALFRHRNFQKWSKPLVFLTFWLRNVLRATTACTFQHLNFQKWSEHGVLCTFWLRNVLRATTACTFSTSQLPKVVRAWCVLYILTWKCASRHNGVHFFDISTSKKVVRDRQFLTLLTSKCASRHNGVQFFISPVASWLRTRRFSEPTFRPSGATNHWKNTVFRDFPTFSRICIFCLLTLSLLLFFLLIFLFSMPLPCSAFHLSILSEVWLLNFLRSRLRISLRLVMVGWRLILKVDDNLLKLGLRFIQGGFWSDRFFFYRLLYGFTIGWRKAEKIKGELKQHREAEKRKSKEAEKRRSREQSEGKEWERKKSKSKSRQT